MVVKAMKVIAEYTTSWLDPATETIAETVPTKRTNICTMHRSNMCVNDVRAMNARLSTGRNRLLV